MKKTRHDGDCSIYAAIRNNIPETGICTCGYGLQYLRQTSGDNSEMYSKELNEKLARERSESRLEGKTK
ncbi:hypothetical protein J4233_03580 [Candidatus Pacearchaeota archaeon]|nr:hypothetical protein [Candidatus Pacearchaeota archaeon]